MAPNPQFPVLDGIAPSWADIIIKATPYGGALIEMIDIKSINSGTTVEVGTVQGASGGRPRKRTTGAVTYDASMVLYKAGYQKLLRNLSQIAPQRGNERLVSLVHFDIAIQHTPPGDVEIYEYRIEGCRVLGRTANDAEGTDPSEVEVALSTIRIVDIVDGLEVVMI